MNDITIIYYTDNCLEPTFEKRVQRELVKAAEGKRIITVSQKPMDFGENFCVGEIGRSHHSLFYQTLVGAEAATTKYMALAEHDCMWTPEHFNWRPPTDDLFYYNVEHYFVQWNGGERDGEYSYHRRKVMSNLICNRELFVQAIKDKLTMLDFGAVIRKGQPGACEPGVCDNRKAFVMQQADMKDVGKETGNYRAAAFRTKLPNLDIRNRSNFSGRRRGKDPKWELPYWGNFNEYWANG